MAKRHNFRNTHEPWDVSFDLGTGSVGWSVTDSTGELFKIKGKPTWGSRIFPSAETAATTRLNRSQRRRYNRRRARLDSLQAIFCDEMAAVDQEFFVRLRQTRLVQKDRYSNPDHFESLIKKGIIPAEQPSSYDISYLHGQLFTETHPLVLHGKELVEADYYKEFPTIWHLRKWLMSTGEKADLRLIYLAFHNIVKNRGNFLYEDLGSKLKSSNGGVSEASEELAEQLSNYASNYSDDPEWDCKPDSKEIAKVLEETSITNSDRAAKLIKAFGFDSKNPHGKNIAAACVGNKAKFDVAFADQPETENTNFKLSDEAKVDTFTEECTDTALPLFQAIQKAYSALTLAGIIKGESSISNAFVRDYEQHKEDLNTTKYLIRTYLGSTTYYQMFRGPLDDSGNYDINKLPSKSYTAYIAGDKLSTGKGCSYEDFIKNLKTLLKSSSSLIADQAYKDVESRLFDPDTTFLSKQKTRSNGAIPYQLHLEEMEAIINNQSKWYPFLDEQKELLLSIVSSRIPYYVGPLNNGHDPKDYYPTNPICPSRKFGWSVRMPGKEHATAHPWNVKDVIDTDQTAERFIRRMTGTCTYLYGEPVLPRCSLLYEKYCVLNELNGTKLSIDGGRAHRFDTQTKQAIYENLFCKRRSISHKALTNWLLKNRNIQNAAIYGTQAEDAFESNLSSYRDFCILFNVESLDDPSCPLTENEIEDIILWSTVFEDRDIFESRVRKFFGDRLTDKQIRKLKNKRYVGWGRLSKELLTDIKVIAPDNQRVSIMDALWEGNPYRDSYNSTSTFMEIITDKTLAFQEKIDEANHQHFKEMGTQLTIDDLPGSPANRRTLNQAARILDELISIAGSLPTHIYVEVTRDNDVQKRGHRTATRYNQLKDALKAFKAESSLLGELDEEKTALDDERLLLYFAQAGKCLYTGKPLDINRLSNYEVDHIIPRSYTKDDSLDNKALVVREANQRKLNDLLLDGSIISKQRSWWSALKHAGLISDKKYARLTTQKLSDRQIEGFINRQLVETSQIVKFFRQLCEQNYPGTEVVSIRAAISHGIREAWNFPKVRELNDFHHAHDAFLAAQVGLFLQIKYPDWQNGIKLSYINKYISSLGKSYQAHGKLPGDSSFFVGTFINNDTNLETGELWDATATRERIHRSLDIRQCFITHMPIQKTGLFWKENAISPRDFKDGKNLSIPLKNSGLEGYLDPKTYGGPQAANQSYSFLFSATNNKGKTQYFFEPVFIYMINHIDDGTLIDYAESIARYHSCHNAKILRTKALFNQQIILNGVEYLLAGKSNKNTQVKTGKQIALNVEETRILSKCLNHPNKCGLDELGKATLLSLHTIAAYAKKTAPKLYEQIKLDSLVDKCLLLDTQQQINFLNNLLALLSGKKASIDLKEFGGAGRAGVMMITLPRYVNNIVWIDQSITGIFETRTKY